MKRPSFRRCSHAPPDALAYCDPYDDDALVLLAAAVSREGAADSPAWGAPAT
ncbi:hypothetical protein ACWD4T_00810 [Streptomyces umbrinus]